MTKANISNRRWFRQVELLLAVATGISWYATAGKLGAWLLIIPLSPWIIRIVGGKPPFRRTSLDWFVLVFLLTAIVGVWASYDREAALGKFWILVGAIFIYYALAGQRQSGLWLAVCTVSAVGAGLSAYFLLTHDWQIWPTDIDMLTQIGQRWMAVRPKLPFPSLHPNILGGQIAVTLPSAATFTVFCWRRRDWLLTWLAAGMLALTATGLLLTSSRAAWAALAAGLGFWALWVFSQHVERRIGLSRNAAFLLMLLILGIAGSWLVFTYTDGPIALLAKLPGPDSATSRLDLMQQARLLAEDFPYTGGGLGAFAGLYSTYILVIPHFFFSYSHNFLLDVMLEQGAAGAVAMIGIMLGSGWLLAAKRRSHRRSSALQLQERQLLRWAMIASLITLMLHGLVDDALYGNYASPLLLMVPGISVALTSRRGRKAREDRGAISSARMNPSVFGLALVCLVVAVIFVRFRQPLLSAWQANLGALEMARVDLVGWPTGGWDNGQNAAQLAPAADLFEEAVRLNPDNRAAQHRLGLIAMLQRDYQTALSYLDAAHQLDPEHRGISKSLGYTYTWQGDWESALPLLVEIPEARNEMDVYVWWWGTQGRPDLAAKAEAVLHQLSLEPSVDSNSK